MSHVQNRKLTKLEALLGLMVFAGFLRLAFLTIQNGYFPQPFFYEASDPWMDWFNTAWWAQNPGAYDAWNTLYPPLSFVLLRFLGQRKCYVDSPGLEVRECDWFGVVAIHSFYLIDIILVARAFYKIDPATSLPRSFAVAAGMPMLFGLERGNLLLICFACVVLGFGPLIKSARLRWFFVGLAVNLKVYVIACVAAVLLRRRWVWFEGAAITSIVVYLASYAILGSGTPQQIYTNITTWSSGFEAGSVLDIWYTNTYKPLISLLEGNSFPITAVIGSELPELGSVVLRLLMIIAQGTIIIGAAAIWLRPEAVPAYRPAMLAISLLLITSETGSYTQTLIFFFVFMERWDGLLRKSALFFTYVLCIPGDIVIEYVPSLVQFSFIAGREVIVQHGIALGMFLRPLLLMLIPCLLAIHTIVLVWNDIYMQNWRHRWRHRHDWPVLPGLIPPASDMPRKIQ